MWDPYQYARFSAPRSRPFYDLWYRLKDLTPARVVDLGCGPGDLTRLFSKRWLGAKVVGVDSSPEMLAIAASYAVPGRLEFVQADFTTWRPQAPVDLLFSNAALQWGPDHATLFPRLAAMVARKGTMAVQMPYNPGSPATRILKEVCQSPAWKDRLGDFRSGGGGGHVQPLTWYVETLQGLGFTVDAWDTTYLHVLEGENAVLEWVKGTALIPILEALEDPASQEAFLRDAGAALAEAYPAGPQGTLFPFRRVFFVATRG